LSTTFFNFFKKFRIIFFYYFIGKKALETEIFILGPYLQKAENNLASKVLSKMRIGVILSL